MASTPAGRIPRQTPFVPQRQGHPMQGESSQYTEVEASSSQDVPMTSAPAIAYPPLQPKDKNYNHKVALGLGVTQIVLGIAAIILQIIAIANEVTFDELGTGIWTGITFIIAGVLGILSSRKTIKRLIVATMVMSVIAGIMAVALVALSVASLVTDADYYFIARDDSFRLNCVMIIVALGELVISTLQSAFGCSVVCCGKSHGLVAYVPKISATGGQADLTPQTLGYPIAIMATDKPDVHVILAPQGLSHPASTIATANSTMDAGQQPLASRPDIIRGDDQVSGSSHYEALNLS